MTDSPAMAASPGATDGLEVWGVTVKFGGVEALSQVDVDVRPGEVRGVIGPNGAGKTTLFDVISGLRRPDAGTIVLDGANITQWSPTARARHGLRRTFQRTQVFGQLSVADNVLMAAEWRGGGGGTLGDVLRLPARLRRERERRDRTGDVLARCGLAEVADVPAGRLPTGLSRMVELARAVIDEPSILMLDEPTSGLDHRECDRLRAVISAMCDRGCGVLLVEHDVSFVMDVCDRILVLDVGRKLADATPPEIRASEAVRSAYLG